MFRILRTLIILPILVCAVNAKVGDERSMLVLLAAVIVNFAVFVGLQFGPRQFFNEGLIDSWRGLLIIASLTTVLWLLLCLAPAPTILLNREASFCLILGYALSGALVSHGTRNKG